MARGRRCFGHVQGEGPEEEHRKHGRPWELHRASVASHHGRTWELHRRQRGAAPPPPATAMGATSTQPQMMPTKCLTKCTKGVIILAERYGDCMQRKAVNQTCHF